MDEILIVVDKRIRSFSFASIHRTEHGTGRRTVGDWPYVPIDGLRVFGWAGSQHCPVWPGYGGQLN